MSHRIIALAPTLALITITLPACAISYEQSMRTRADLRWLPGAPPDVTLDERASFVQVTTDDQDVGLALDRYDRDELARSVRRGWSHAAGYSDPPLPGDAERARFIILADIRRADSEVASAVLHGITGYTTTLFGAPVACAGAEVTFVLEAASGATFFGQATGHDCEGLYDTADASQGALADGLGRAIDAVRPVTQDQLAMLLPDLWRVPNATSTWTNTHLGWGVEPTAEFPSVWGARDGSRAQPVAIVAQTQPELATP